MTWVLKRNEIDSVTALDAPARCEYCVKKIADEGRLFGLKGDMGWAIAGDDEGCELFPIWPHAEYAAMCAVGQWEHYLPQAIDVGTWLARWLPGLERDRRLVAVFPTPDGKGAPFGAARFSELLHAAMEDYE